MSDLWRMERKRDKNVREMKVQGLGATLGLGGPSNTLLNSPTKHQPGSRAVACPTLCGGHSWRGQPAPLVVVRTPSALHPVLSLPALPRCLRPPPKPWHPSHFSYFT